MNLWFVGALLSLLACCLENLGFTLQKLSFSRNTRLLRSEQLPLLSQPVWLTGSALVVVGTLGNFVSLAFAAQSLVAPIGSVSLIANMGFARLLLGESVSKRDLVATALIMAGGALSVAVGDHSSPSMQLSDFLSLFLSPAGLGYCVLAVALCVALSVLVRWLHDLRLSMVSRQRRLSMNARLISPALAAPLSAKAAVSTARAQQELSVLTRRYSPWERWHPFLCCALAGLFGAVSELFGKMVAELVSTSVGGNEQLLSVFPYLFLCLMLLSIGLQIHWLAEALMLFDALYCVPMFQCCYVLASTLGGATFWAELQQLSVWESAAFSLGVLIVLGGIVLLADRGSGAAEFKSRRTSMASGAAMLVMLRRDWAERKRRQARSRSQNWPAQAGRGRGQREREAVQAMGAVAARLTQFGQMKLPPSVELSIAALSRQQTSRSSRRITATTAAVRRPVLGQARHKRSQSLPTYSALSLVAAAAAVPSSLSPPPAGNRLVYAPATRDKAAVSVPWNSAPQPHGRTISLPVSPAEAQSEAAQANHALSLRATAQLVRAMGAAKGTVSRPVKPLSPVSGRQLRGIEEEEPVSPAEAQTPSLASPTRSRQQRAHTRSQTRVTRRVDSAVSRSKEGGRITRAALPGQTEDEELDEEDEAASSALRAEAARS